MVQASTIKKAVLGLTAGATLVIAGTAAAANHPGNTRPGWGYGDKNHVHTGPPGQSVSVTNTNTASTIVNNTQAAVSGNARGNHASSGDATNAASISASSNASSHTTTSQ
jgi:hypothetical protein